MKHFGDDGRLTDDGKKLCLNCMLSQCKDFQDENSDLEFLVEEISDKVDCNFSILFAPKFHCELAGEGIEYSWGASKKIYRRYPLSIRKTFELFQAAVLKALRSVNIISCRRFSAKSRRYMMVYQHQQLSPDETLSLEGNEKLLKLYKSHRDVAKTDASFIVKIMKESMGVDVSDISSSAAVVGSS